MTDIYWLIRRNWNYRLNEADISLQVVRLYRRNTRIKDMYRWRLKGYSTNKVTDTFFNYHVRTYPRELTRQMAAEWWLDLIPVSDT